jgi:hypothetical protein
MKKAFWASILLMVAGTATAENRMRVLENGIEAWASAIVLPSQSLGTLEFKSCRTCKLHTLEIDRDTEFFVGDREVSFAELKQQFAAKPNAAVLIVTPKSKTVVSRIQVSLDAVVNESR